MMRRRDLPNEPLLGAQLNGSGPLSISSAISCIASTETIDGQREREKNVLDGQAHANSKTP